MNKLVLLAMLSVSCPFRLGGQSLKTACLSGEIKGFAKQPVVICDRTANQAIPDTLVLSEKGTFSATYSIGKPEEAYLHVNNGTTDYSYCLYLSPGASLTVNVETDAAGVNVSFGGDTGYQSEYENLRREMCTLSSTFSDEAWLKQPDFKACKQYIAAQQQRLKKVLKKVSDPLFMQKEMDVLQSEVPVFCFHYASVKEANGCRMEEDTEFMDFVKQINLNDTAQVNLISDYLDWYMLAYPDTFGLPVIAAKLRYAKAMIANRDVLNKLAENALTMIAFVGMFGGDTSTIAYPIYKEFLAVSTDEAMCANIRKQLQTMAYQQKGAEAAGLKMHDAEGNACSLKDVVGKGRYTYIDFWATWCGPCCKEIPYLEALVAKYKGNPAMRFVSISLDTNKEAWLKKLAADKPEWEQYNIPQAEQGACAELYGISGIPRFILFDKEGKMMNASASRPSDESTQELLNKLADESVR